jgi:hypothetical protein
MMKKMCVISVTGVSPERLPDHFGGLSLFMLLKGHVVPGLPHSPGSSAWEAGVKAGSATCGESDGP